jgi:hypothetical protein
MIDFDDIEDFIMDNFFMEYDGLLDDMSQEEIESLYNDYFMENYQYFVSYDDNDLNSLSEPQEDIDEKISEEYDCVNIILPATISGKKLVYVPIMTWYIKAREQMIMLLVFVYFSILRKH